MTQPVCIMENGTWLRNQYVNERMASSGDFERLLELVLATSIGKELATLSGAEQSD